MQTLILKSLNACNLRCAYCSLGDKENFEILPEDRMRDALHFFAARASQEGEKQVQVIFHGGEPMLRPPEEYGRCIQSVMNAFPELRFRFSMQTNGTLLTPAYLALFQEWDIHIGISLDGGQAVHDGQRRDGSGKGTYAVVMQNIRTLLANDVPVSALMVVTRPALEADLGFLKELDALGVPLKINPLLDLGEAAAHPELALRPGDYGGYLIRVFQYIASEGLSIHLSPLAELLHAILYEKTPRGCLYQPSCCRMFLCVDQTGTLYPCGRFADVRVNALGDIDGGISPAGAAVLDRLEARRTSALPEKCRTCRYLPFCNAGCSADGSGESVPCAVCEDQKVLLHYLRTDGMEIVKRQLIEERAGLLKTLEETRDGI